MFRHMLHITAHLLTSPALTAEQNVCHVVNDDHDIPDCIDPNPDAFDVPLDDDVSGAAHSSTQLCGIGAAGCIPTRLAGTLTM